MWKLKIHKFSIEGLWMKITLIQLIGWCWITAVLCLYAAQVRYRPSGAVGSLLKSFFDSMAASYLQ